MWYQQSAHKSHFKIRHQLEITTKIHSQWPTVKTTMPYSPLSA